MLAFQAWIALYAQVEPAPVIAAHGVAVEQVLAASAAGVSVPVPIAANVKAMPKHSATRRSRRSARPRSVSRPGQALWAWLRMVLAFIATPEIRLLPWPSAHGGCS